MRKKAERVVYYRDALRDDFAGTNIDTCRVGADFPFAHGWLWNAVGTALYYVVAAPLVFLISWLYLGLKFENRRALRGLRRSGYFLYGNHTRNLDAFLPAVAAFPKRAYIITGPDAVSLPLLRNVVMMLGAIPIPTEFSAMRKFLTAVTERFRQRHCVAVFPEAHVWPFYTGIRPFPDTSFGYPAKENAPSIVMVTTYRRRRGLFRFAKKPGMTVTFSDPIYPDPALPPRQAQKELRDRAHAFMLAVSSGRENVEYIRYIQTTGDASVSAGTKE